jgi:hypothetical protein
MTPQSEVERIARIIIDNVRPPTQAEFDAIIVRAGNAARINGLAAGIDALGAMARRPAR